jgi:hypothetical protein
MPTTPRGLTYPDDSGHVRMWEHIQQLAEDVDDEFDALLTDTGWTAITLAAGIVSVITPQYKKVGGQVFLRGQVGRTASAAFVVGSTTLTGAALPVGFRPPNNVSMAGGASPTGTVTCRINVTAAGVLSVTIVTAGPETAMMDGLSFWTDA